MLNQSSSSSTKNYIDVCGEINECNSTAAAQQRLLGGGDGVASRQLKQEEPVVTATGTGTCAVVTSDTSNMNTNDEAGCMASLFQTPPWASVAILPPHNLSQQQGGVARDVGSTNHPLAMRYPSFDGATAAAAAKDSMNSMNTSLYQFQDLDMIASIVAKEQALLKMNTAVAAASSGGEHSRLTGFAIPNRAHTQVIVNGARENMSSPSEMSPTCSPSSSDTLQSTHGGATSVMHAHNEHPGPEDSASKSGNESPVDVTSLMKDNKMDVGRLFGVSHLNGHLSSGGSSDLTPRVSANQLIPSSSTVGSFTLAYQQHSLGPSNSSQQHQQQQPSSSRESNGQSGTTLRSRHRSNHHDGLIKCHYCPKKWADQAVLRVHMEECRLLRMHECQQCGKRFKARGGLQQHLRIHSNDRPYQCRFCPKRFTQKSHVDQHERIHTGAKPFSCQFCGRAFRQRSQQLGHEATHASGPLSISAHLSHTSTHHLKFENTNRDQGCSQATAAAGDVTGSERTAAVHQQTATAVAAAAAVAVVAQQQDRLNSSDNSSLSLMSPNGSGLAHSAVSSLLALSQQQQQSQGMAISQSTQQTIADAINARNTAV